jgi:hypothetical protein
LVVSLWALGCGGSSSDGDPVDGAVATDASPADAADETTPDAADPSAPDASSPSTPDADPSAPDSGAGTADGGTGPCSVAPTEQECRDCVIEVGQACLGPCAIPGAALIACGNQNGCCTSATECDPACLQRECPTQVQAVLTCVMESCQDEIRVCF